MASSTEQELFERLRESNEKLNSSRRADVEHLVQTRYELAQKRLAELISDNTTLPVVLNSIRIDGAIRTREGFLKKVLDPNFQKAHSLEGVMQDLQKTTDTLRRFDIFQPDISLYLDTPGAIKRDPNQPLSVNAIINVKERARTTLQTGTDIGNTEGTGHLHLTQRNIFGGAESFVLSAATGTRTRSSYNALFSTPINSNPDLVLSAEGWTQTRSNQHYASHDEAQRGGRFGINFLDKLNARHDISYSYIIRNLVNLSENASPTVRLSAGETIKSALTHTMTIDTRDHPLLPHFGSFFKAVGELAGLGTGVSHLKYEVDFQTAQTVAATTKFPVTFTGGVRAGLLYPLAPSLLSTSTEKDAQPSLLPDRFQQGGPTTVRGFRENGLGPRDGNDSIGGDAYVTAGASALFPLPNVGKERPVRFQAWVNSGRLVALQQPGLGGIQDAVKEMADGIMSTSAGVGLVYAHPAARFELNVGLPLVLRKGEKARKGLQFGVGLSFM